jgi:hypothetical protein
MNASGSYVKRDVSAPNNVQALPTYANTMNKSYVSHGQSELDMLAMKACGRKQEPQSLDHQSQILAWDANAGMIAYGSNQESQSLDHQPQLVPWDANAGVSSVGVNMQRNYLDTLRQAISSQSPISVTQEGFNPNFQTPNYAFGMDTLDPSSIPIYNFQVPQYITMPPTSSSIPTSNMSVTQEGFNPNFQTPNYGFGMDTLDPSSIPIYNSQVPQHELFSPQHITMPPSSSSIPTYNMSLCYPSKVFPPP